MLRAFLSPQAKKTNDRVCLDADETHHLVKVRRVQTGESVEILDGKGLIIEATFDKLEAGKAQLHIQKERLTEKRYTSISIAQSMLKSKAMDFFIQKAIELNISEIYPLLTDNSEIKLDKVKSQKKSTKWQQQAIEAIKQSGNPWLPMIHEPQNLTSYLEKKNNPNELCITGSLEKEALPLHKYLTTISNKTHIHFLIGPEGDFSEKEYELLQQKEWKAANFGSNVLRAETASLYALSVANYEISKLFSV